MGARRKSAARRVNITKAVRSLIRDMAGVLPELAHVRADRVLVVSGEARRNSRATIRPLRFPDGGTRAGRRRKPAVRFKGKQVLYLLTLRPLFFRSSTAEKRVETILHELFHASPRFDGTLDPARRHREMPGDDFEKALRPLVKRYLARCDAALLELLRANTDVLARQWLEKPAASYALNTRHRTRFADAQTFLGPVRMVTRATRH